jgi:diacylglycerol kinase (ATP)
LRNKSSKIVNDTTSQKSMTINPTLLKTPSMFNSIVALNLNKRNWIETKFMNNYVSIGCDALVTLNFHRQRKSLFMANRIFNKLIYFKYGTIDTFLKECRELSQNVELKLDNKVVELPYLESIVVLNIKYWGGGVEPWSLGSKSSSASLTDTIPQQSINDGLLEVFGIYSSFHIAQMNVGLAEPYRIGQAHNVSIKLKKRYPMQIDGEPWEQTPASININRYNQANMLLKIDSN